MHLIKPLASEQSTVLVIISPRGRKGAIERLLDKYAFVDWRMSDLIYLFTIEDQYVSSKGHIAKAIRTQCKAAGLDQRKTNAKYYVLDEIKKSHCMETLAWTDWENVYSKSFNKLADDYLEIRLKEWNLHWISKALQEVQKWHFDDFKEDHLHAWLKQFDIVSSGTNRWVGERLLKHFKIWSSETLANEFQKVIPKENEEPRCILRYENGKSADAISIILRKKATGGDDKIFEYGRFLADEATSDCIVFEDGLFTGVEICDLFSSLCGVDGFNKCQPLKNPARLKQGKTLLIFGIATDIGLSRLQENIDALKINVEVRSGQQIKVLTPLGEEYLKEKVLYELDEDGKSVLSDSMLTIECAAFSESKFNEHRDEAMAFIRDIGYQLWASYQKVKGKVWTERRLNDCALGAGNMGLLFSFSHSMPKSTLPVFWCHGTVEGSNKKVLEWEPLFPSAHNK